MQVPKITKSKNKCDINKPINISDIEQRFEHTIHLYTDEECQNEFDLQTPISGNLKLWPRYILNQYTYKFIDDDGTILKTSTADYGTIITPPETPDNKDPYTTFDYWEKYADGMTLTDDIEFTAVYKYKDYIITVKGHRLVS